MARASRGSCPSEEVIEMWFKVDDSLATHPKVLEAGNAAMGLWVRAGAWCAQQLTDGFVSAAAVSMLGTREEADALVAADLWDEVEGGFQFHQWDERQPSRADAEERREADRQRKAAWRAAKAAKREASQHQSQRDANVTPFDVTEDETTESALPVPVPVPVPNKSVVSEDRPDVERLLDLLDSELTKNGVKKLPSRNKTNRDAMRLLMDRDGRSEEQIANAIRWCQSDEFWRGNILSASKLREKYETLRAQATRGRRGAAVVANLSLAEQYENEERKEVGA